MPTLDQIVQRQLRRWEMEARALRESAAPGRGGRPYPFVTLSRDHGSVGEEVAEKLAQRLNWTCLNRQIVDYVAAHAHVRAQWLELLDEHARGQVESWLRSHLTGRYLDQSDYARHLAHVLQAVIHHEPVVILGRGAVYMLSKQSEYGLHVRVIAPLDLRVRRVAESEGLTLEQARLRVLSVDHERQEFLKSVYHRDGRDPLDYDLVINAARWTPDSAAAVIASALAERGLLPVK